MTRLFTPSRKRERERKEKAYFFIFALKTIKMKQG
jgi:hypothetical protein